MIQKKRIWASLVGAAVLAGGIAIAQDHDHDLWRHHPNLGAAERSTQQAIESLHAAQRANRGHMGGHADRAERLLRQAESEIHAAAVTLNH